MPGFAAFLRVGVLSSSDDAAVAEGFLDYFWVSGCQVEKMTTGMPQGMAGDPRSFESGIEQVCVHDVVDADP